MDESEYAILANQCLQGLAESIEDQCGEQCDVDYQDGILTIELDDGRSYVINKHAPNRQIWLSSPLSGASHFSYEPGQGWISTRGNGSLMETLGDEFRVLTGHSISF